MKTSFAPGLADPVVPPVLPIPSIASFDALLQLFEISIIANRNEIPVKSLFLEFVKLFIIDIAFI
jgi:hypothetical protein